MLKQRTASGYSKALLTGIKKSGKQFPCEITSAVFIDERGITLATTTIADLSLKHPEAKVIDTKNNKTVAANIVLAKSAQK
ncbi:MAG: hypothetical protein IPL50_07655 [Chitinophagaceae bacterium]|nr:hypothetical protein [Chitinophagaceae bacterium]